MLKELCIDDGEFILIYELTQLEIIQLRTTAFEWSGNFWGVRICRVTNINTGDESYHPCNDWIERIKMRVLVPLKLGELLRAAENHGAIAKEYISELGAI